MDQASLNQFKQINNNAYNAKWFISPLEYSWTNGQKLFEELFKEARKPSLQFDELSSPQIYQTSMQCNFRSQIIVLAFMKQNIAKSYGLEIENGLMHLYKLDFVSCISQWIYVIEGYCRKLFNINNIKQKWILPTCKDLCCNTYITTISVELERYVKDILFASTKVYNNQILNRHVLYHGNNQNSDIFNQKNCLILMFLLDALVCIESASNGALPYLFSPTTEEKNKINRRQYLYHTLLKNTLSEDDLLRSSILKEH